jgi:hypothetical protein
VEILAQGIHLGPRFADHDARPGSANVHFDLVGVLLDRDVREAGVRELARDVIADLDVLEKELGKVAQSWM